MTLKVSKLSFAESVLDMDRPAGGSRRRPLFRPDKKPVLLMPHLVSTFYSPGGTILEFCIGRASNIKACLLAPKYFELFGCEANSSCPSDTMPSIIKVFARQILKNDTGINENEDTQEAGVLCLKGEASAEEMVRKDV